MKLTIKTLQRFNFKIDVEPDKTVKELKQKIADEHGKDYPVALQKLIYDGKILADDNKLHEYKFDEKKFIVLMVTCPTVKPTPSPKDNSCTVKKEETSSAPSAVTRSKDDRNKSLTTGSLRSTAGSSSSTTTTTATTASTNSPNSETSSANVSAPSAQARNSPARNSSSGIREALLMSESQVAPRLAALMTDPHFRQMQEVIQQTPQLLSSRIEELSTTNPEMYRFISENPDAFVNMLNHPLSSGILPTGRDSDTEGRQSPSLQGTARDRGTGSLSVADFTQHDKEAIGRLKELGFTEFHVLQAYMACDRDEQLAANLLLQMEQ